MDFILPAQGFLQIGRTRVPFHNRCTAEANGLLTTREYWGEPRARNMRTLRGGELYRPLSSRLHYPLQVAAADVRELLDSALLDGRSYERLTPVVAGSFAELEYEPATHLLVDVWDGGEPHQAIVFVTADNAVFVDFEPAFAAGVSPCPSWADVPAIWRRQYRQYRPTMLQRGWDNGRHVLALLFLLALGLYNLARGRSPSPAS